MKQPYLNIKLSKKCLIIESNDYNTLKGIALVIEQSIKDSQ